MIVVLHMPGALNNEPGTALDALYIHLTLHITPYSGFPLVFILRKQNWKVKVTQPYVTRLSEMQSKE